MTKVFRSSHQKLENRRRILAKPLATAQVKAPPWAMMQFKTKISAKTQRKKEHPEFIDSLGAFAPLREHILSNCTSTLAILKPLR